MLAKASHDLGDSASAMRQARAAYICADQADQADQADHPAMRGWVRGLQSLIAYWAGRPMDAAHYAQSGAATASRATGTLAVWLTSLQARAHAVLGDSEALGHTTVAALTAREAVEAYRSASAGEWAFSDEAGAYTNLALARIAVGSVEGAAEAARPVLDLPPEKRTAGVILSAQRVHRALSAGTCRTATSARELRAEIEAFTSVSARALPR